MRKAGSRAAQYLVAPVVSFARESMWSADKSVLVLPTRTVGIEGVQPGLHSRHGHAITNSDFPDVGLVPNQHLRNDIDWRSGMNSKVRLALMPLLHDLAVAVIAAQ